MLSTNALDPVSAAVRAAPYPPAGASWYTTIMLSFLYWLSLLDRYIITLLIDPIKRDMGITDVQFGILNGLAFAGTFTIFGFLFGALADRLNRRWVIYIGVSIWSIATMLCGIVHSFSQLLLARVGVGAGEAALNPCATSIISDLFPREKLTRAMAVYALGSTVGSGTALVVGGAIVDAAANWGDTQWPLIGPIRYWQMVFMIIGVPGSLLALIVFSISEPVRRGSQVARAAGSTWWSTYRDLFRFMRTQPRLFIFHYVGFTLATLVITGNATWFPVHMTRAFGWSASRIGLVLGVTLTGAGIASKLICGWCVDAMYARGYRDAQLRWFASCLGIGMPIGLVATTSDNPYIFLSGVGFFMLCLSSMPACALTALNLVTPNELRGSGVAMWTTVTGIVGGGMGTLIIAALSQHAFNGPHSIGLGMATQLSICCPLGASSLFLGLRPMRAAMAKIES